MLVPLIGATLLAKFSIPPFASIGIGIGIGLTFLALCAGLVSGRLHLSTSRVIGLSLMLAFAGLTAVFTASSYSFKSLLFLVAVHLPYVACSVQRGIQRDQIFEWFSHLCRCLAWCGVAQFLIQQLVGPTWAFPIESFLPEMVQVQAFNKQGPLAYGYELYRANGVFLLEPSFFSQLMAIAIVQEVCGRMRLTHLLPCAAALLLSYSGTGMLVLAICLPVLMFTHARWGIVPLGIVAALTIYLAADFLNLELFVNRSSEFTSTGSSAFARFVGGFYLFEQFLWGEPLKALFGFGAGTFKEYSAQVSVPVAEMALPKMVFEYGVIGAILYFGLLTMAVFSSPAPFAFRLAVYVTFYLNGNLIPFSHGLALSLFVWPTKHRDSSMGAQACGSGH